MYSFNQLFIFKLYASTQVFPKYLLIHFSLTTPYYYTLIVSTCIKLKANKNGKLQSLFKILHNWFSHFIQNKVAICGLLANKDHISKSWYISCVSFSFSVKCYTRYITHPSCLNHDSSCKEPDYNISTLSKIIKSWVQKYTERNKTCTTIYITSKVCRTSIYFTYQHTVFH